jgi:hypothetical protein
LKFEIDHIKEEKLKNQGKKKKILKKTAVYSEFEFPEENTPQGCI